MVGKSLSRVVFFICVVLTALSALPGEAQTSEIELSQSEERGVEVQPGQRDLVTASNADAFLFGDEYPRVDVAVGSDDVLCFRHVETHDYEAPKSVTLDTTWCVNNNTGLVSAATEATVFGMNLEVQGAFCSWSSKTGEIKSDAIVCHTLVQEEQCVQGNECVNEEYVRLFRADGTTLMVNQPMTAPAYDALEAYPLSG